MHRSREKELTERQYKEVWERSDGEGDVGRWHSAVPVVVWEWGGTGHSPGFATTAPSTWANHLTSCNFYTWEIKKPGIKGDEGPLGFNQGSPSPYFCQKNEGSRGIGCFTIGFTAVKGVTSVSQEVQLGCQLLWPTHNSLRSPHGPLRLWLVPGGAKTWSTIIELGMEVDP